MTLVPVCLGYTMKTENVKANPKVTAEKRLHSDYWQNNPCDNVTGLTSWGKTDDKITLK